MNARKSIIGNTNNPRPPHSVTLVTAAKRVSKNLSRSSMSSTSDWPQASPDRQSSDVTTFSTQHNDNTSLFYETEPTRLCTGSTYDGGWNQFGMNGQGKYTFPDGVVYEGHISKGHFNGIGKLTYPNGSTIRGVWKKGVGTGFQFRFPDGLAFKETNWKYCTPESDRRFYPDETLTMKGIGQHIRMPAHMNTQPIPPDCYNTGEGFYNPKSKCLYSLLDPTEVIRIPTSAEEKWIVAHCPKAIEEFVGPCKTLLEPLDYQQFIID